MMIQLVLTMCEALHILRASWGWYFIILTDNGGEWLLHSGSKEAVNLGLESTNSEYRVCS